MKLLFVMLTSLFCFHSFCQRMDKTSLTFENKVFQLYQEQPGDTQYLIIKDSNKHVLNKIELEKEYDPYCFMAKRFEERKTAVIGGRYQFFILNGSSGQVTGPFRVTQRGLAQDGQSGVLYTYKLIENSKYLLVNAIDFGLFCYDIENLNEIKTVQFFKSDSMYFRGTYCFLDLNKDNRYNMISASCGNYKTKIGSEFYLRISGFNKTKV